MAVVEQGNRKKVYRSPLAEEERLAQAIDKPEGILDIDLPEKGLGFRVQAYGLKKHRDLYTGRQLRTLTAISAAIDEVTQEVLDDAEVAGLAVQAGGLGEGGSGAKAYAEAVKLFLGLGLDRCVDFNNALCRWVPRNEKVMNLFARAAVPMVWDFAEANLLGEGVGAWQTCSDYVADCLATLPFDNSCQVSIEQLDAAALPVRTGAVVSTDPPYYDNIGYADLSDILYVWLRPLAKTVFPSLFSTLLVPKAQELVADASRKDGDSAGAAEAFQTGFKHVFSALKSQMDARYPLTVYYAFKQSESDTDVASSTQASSESTGWATMLDSLVSSGFQVTGTWPIRASQSSRIRSLGSNALASYVVLVCRPRSDAAALSTRKELLAALREELPLPVRRLQGSGIAPVDLAQAAVGPGMAVFSRYSRVLESDGSDMRVGTALGLINQVLDETLAEQESEFDGDTRWAIAWFEQHAFNEGSYGDAESMCRAKNTSVQGMVDAGIIAARAGKVRLLSRAELDDDWNPATDKRLTIWEMTQHLIRRLDTGEAAAAGLARRLGSNATIARDLAYRLFLVCEHRKWSQEAMAYNALVVAWPQIQQLSAAERVATGPSQTSFDV
jgi:putative DNA methylase